MFDGHAVINGNGNQNIETPACTDTTHKEINAHKAQEHDDSKTNVNDENATNANGTHPPRETIMMDNEKENFALPANDAESGEGRVIDSLRHALTKSLRHTFT